MAKGVLGRVSEWVVGKPPAEVPPRRDPEAPPAAQEPLVVSAPYEPSPFELLSSDPAPYEPSPFEVLASEPLAPAPPAVPPPAPQPVLEVVEPEPVVELTEPTSEPTLFSWLRELVLGTPPATGTSAEKRRALRVRNVLLQGEQVVASLDMKGEGRGYVALTDRRVIVGDRVSGFRTDAAISIPYAQIVSVAAADERAFWQSDPSGTVLTLMVRNGSSYIFAFEDVGRAHRLHDLILSRILY
jgi:hypothetical protein